MHASVSGGGRVFLRLYFNSAVPACFLEDTRVLWTSKTSRIATYRELHLCDMVIKESLSAFTAGFFLAQ